MASRLGPSLRQIKMTFPNISNADQIAIAIGTIDLEELNRFRPLEMVSSEVSLAAALSMDLEELAEWMSPECIPFLLFCTVSVLCFDKVGSWLRDGRSVPYRLRHVTYVSMIITLTLIVETFGKRCSCLSTLVEFFASPHVSMFCRFYRSKLIHDHLWLEFLYRRDLGAEEV